MRNISSFAFTPDAFVYKPQKIGLGDFSQRLERTFQDFFSGFSLDTHTLQSTSEALLSHLLLDESFYGVSLSTISVDAGRSLLDVFSHSLRANIEENSFHGLGFFEGQLQHLSFMDEDFMRKYNAHIHRRFWENFIKALIDQNSFEKLSDLALEPFHISKKGKKGFETHLNRGFLGLLGQYYTINLLAWHQRSIKDRVAKTKREGIFRTDGARLLPFEERDEELLVNLFDRKRDLIRHLYGLSRYILTKKEYHSVISDLGLSLELSFMSDHEANPRKRLALLLNKHPFLLSSYFSPGKKNRRKEMNDLSNLNYSKRKVLFGNIHFKGLDKEDLLRDFIKLSKRTDLSVPV